MKKIWNLMLLLMFASPGFGQNLVNNPSFEDTVMCPTNVDQMERAVAWSAYRISPDYFNSCNPVNFVGIPANWAGFQLARTGNAYAGLIAYYTLGQNGRECIGTQLIQPLVIGHEYFVSFYVTMAVNNIFSINIATDKMGAKFSTVGYSYASPIPIDNASQIYSDSIISDTLNWVQVSGYFIADSAYQYLSIGSFFRDSATTHISFDSSAAFAYYYVDDVLVADSTFTGIDDNNLTSTIEIFPNPIHDEIIIRGNNIKSICICDASGRKCIERAFVTSIKTINTSSLDKGIYFIRVNTLKNSFVKKIIKQ